MPKKTQSNANNNIRQYREHLGLTQSDFANEAAISITTLKRYESKDYSGNIPLATKEKIARSLGKNIEAVFPPIDAKLSRREFIGEMSGAALGMGIGLGMLSEHDFLSSNSNHQRRSLSKDEVSILADDNFGTWMLFDNLQKGNTTNYVSAVAQGKVVTLTQLAQSSILPQQKEQILILLGDAYLILGRLSREAQNFGAGEEYFQKAMFYAKLTNNSDLKAAIRQRYGFMLIDQQKISVAVKNGQAALIESKGASFPIWAEAQLIAAHALAHAGQFQEAQKIAYQARDAKRGADPDMWIGNIKNPAYVHELFDVSANLAAGKYYDSAQAAEKTIKFLDKQEPDNLQARIHIQWMQATALWEFGAIDDSIMIARNCLNSTQMIGSVINETRLDKLYQRMKRSPYAKRNDVRELGEQLMSSEAPL